MLTVKVFSESPCYGKLWNENGAASGTVDKYITILKSLSVVTRQWILRMV